MKLCYRLFALLIITVMLLFLCACGSLKLSDPKIGVWTATTGSMDDASISIKDVLDCNISFQLKAMGQARISVDEESENGIWLEEDGLIIVSAGGVDLIGTIVDGAFVAENVLNTGVTLTFEKEGGYNLSD